MNKQTPEMRYPMEEKLGKRVLLKKSWMCSLSAVALATVLVGQDADSDAEIFDLSPFEVSTDQDVGYRSTNSTSGTSLNSAIRDLPMSIQVINQDFITDLGASNLEEALSYSAGVFTEDNQASSNVGSIRGVQGGGSGDRSISSAADGDRFANSVYIRGLSTPIQNRMGFRYGGVVVTPNSSIALGGLLDSANIERIEVVKGPNSLLYGVGVLTGIVNVIPEKPLSEPRYEFGVKAGSYEFLRTHADITGPLPSEIIPGTLNYRLAGSYEERENWSDFRSDQTEYWVAQLDYSPTKWANLFLEYQDGLTQVSGIGSQWIYDDVNGANDTEFRNEFGEAYAWARHDGLIPGLRPLDPNGYSVSTPTVDDSGVVRNAPAFRLLDDEFVGGGTWNGYRITGPDTFAERDESNFLADLTLTPIENLTINAGAFFSEQSTFERTLQFNSANASTPNNFVTRDIPGDAQLESIWLSGGIYGVPMQDSLKRLFGISQRVDSSTNPGNYLLPATTDDIKLIEYWWRDSVVKSKSEQYRLRATYTFETPFINDSVASHTILAGISHIEDDVDFPDGGINRGNARTNSSNTEYYGDTLIDSPSVFGTPVDRPFDNDGLYYRSIANFSPIYFDGRNDGVNGHNTVRAGDVFMNQVIKQTGIYGVYQGKFFNDRLEIIAGVRQDRYNADQLTYKRANVTDEFLRSEALKDLEDEAINLVTLLTGEARNNFSEESLAMVDDIIANRTQDDQYITSWYRDSFESGDEGFFGYANRGNAPDETYGIVPGSQFSVFEEDVKATTGTFGVSFDINDQWTVYGVVAQGISPNTALRDGAGDIIPAEETLNKEIGLKFELMEGKISGNVAMFQIDRKNAIWDVRRAPAAAKWIDAINSNNRASNWTAPTFDPETPSTYFVRGDYLVNYIAEEFGVDPSKLNFAQQGRQIQQQVQLQDLDPNLSIPQRLALIRDIQEQTLMPEEFATEWNTQSPFNGNVQISLVGINTLGLDDVQEVTIYNPETNEFITKDISNLPVLYSAFADRELDKTKNELFREIHPIRYRRFTSFGQPQGNNNVDFDQASGALVTFNEEINGVEVEIFYTPTPNLQFVFGYSHIEREATDSFQFTEWESISEAETGFIAPFTMLHREHGWGSAGIQSAWVDVDAYQQALASSSDGIVALESIGEGFVEMIPEDQVDATISNSEFAAKSNEGKMLILVDKRGDVINDNNSARATDFDGIINGISLNFNPEDVATLYSKYMFTEGKLEGLSLTAGVKYTGPSATSIAFQSVSPLSELTVTPEVAERFQFDVGLSYKWRWRDMDLKFSINVYDVFENTYDVTTTLLDTANPITGEEVLKRTEVLASPTTYRVGLTVNF